MCRPRKVKHSGSLIALVRPNGDFLVVGKRIGAWYGSPRVWGEGVIVELLDGGEGDCRVLLDGRDHSLGFYRHELTVPKPPVFDASDFAAWTR